MYCLAVLLLKRICLLAKLSGLLSAQNLIVEGRVDELLMSPDTTRTFVRSANQVYVYDTRDPSDVEQIQLLSANEENANIVSAQLLGRRKLIDAC